MKKEPRGNDIKIKWSLFGKNDEPFNLENLDLSLYLRGMFAKKPAEGYKVEGNTIQWTFFGKDQKHNGVYSLTLVVNEGKEGMITTHACDFVELVDCPCKAGGEDAPNVETETIVLTSTLEYVAGGGSYDDTEIRNELANKVDKEAGKGLSSNDYTDEDKEKLDSLENYDDSELSRELTELSAEVGKKVDAKFVNNAIAAAITITLNTEV